MPILVINEVLYKKLKFHVHHPIPTHLSDKAFKTYSAWIDLAISINEKKTHHSKVQRDWQGISGEIPWFDGRSNERWRSTLSRPHVRCLSSRYVQGGRCDWQASTEATTMPPPASLWKEQFWAWVWSSNALWGSHTCAQRRQGLVRIGRGYHTWNRVPTQTAARVQEHFSNGVRENWYHHWRWPWPRYISDGCKNWCYFIGWIKREGSHIVLLWGFSCWNHMPQRQRRDSWTDHKDELIAGLNVIATKDLTLFLDQNKEISCTFGTSTIEAEHHSSQKSLNATLYMVGDLACYAMVLGKESMSGHHWYLCKLSLSEFVDLIRDGDPWSYNEMNSLTAEF